jgi:ribosomal protein S18 acetylase RimI-like enzyme
MEIKIITENKEKYMDLLLLGDEQENMVRKYLFKGIMYALFEPDLRTVCVVTKENEEVYEIKNIATYKKYQEQGYGRKMIEYIIEQYKNKGKILLVGTGDNEKTVTFYKNLGFKESHIVTDFFIKNYDHKIIENGKQLVDMIYLKLRLTTLCKNTIKYNECYYT